MENNNTDSTGNQANNPSKNQQGTMNSKDKIRENKNRQEVEGQGSGNQGQRKEDSPQ